MIQAARFKNPSMETDMQAKARIRGIIEAACARYFGVTSKGFMVHVTRTKFHGVCLEEADWKYLPFIKSLAKEFGYKIKVNRTHIRFMT